VFFQIVSLYAFNKSRYANDPDCDADFETMRLAFIYIFISVYELQFHHFSVFCCAFVFFLPFGLKIFEKCLLSLYLASITTVRLHLVFRLVAHILSRVSTTL